MVKTSVCFTGANAVCSGNGSNVVFVLSECRESRWSDQVNTNQFILILSYFDYMAFS